MVCGVIGLLGVLFCVGVLVTVCSVVRAGGCVVIAVVGGWGGGIAWCICLVGAGDRAGFWVVVWCMMGVWYKTSCGFVLCRVGCLVVGLWVRV